MTPARQRLIGRYGMAAGVAAVAIGTLSFLIARSAGHQAIPPRARLERFPPGKSLEIPNVNKPIAPEDAVKVNALRPFEGGDDTPASRFGTAKTGKSDLDRAVECLAQAVYYEAASEGIDGERAVAQVVLNRVRHPGFPSSVCGAVYQGSERVTGCQFTFTCDGSLRRIPSTAGWARARKVATDALIKGVVFAPVGHSTHYHADYVVPYWAASMTKQAQIGAHIFYRLPGSLGKANAFSQRYARSEPLPPTPNAEVVVEDAISEALGTRSEIVLPDPLESAKGGEVIVLNKAPALAADEGKGKLIDREVGQLATGPGCLRGSGTPTNPSSPPAKPSSPKADGPGSLPVC